MTTQAKWWPQWADNVDFVLILREGDVMIGNSVRDRVGTKWEALAIEPELDYTPDPREHLELNLVVERAIMGCHLAARGVR